MLDLQNTKISKYRWNNAEKVVLNVYTLLGEQAFRFCLIHLEKNSCCMEINLIDTPGKNSNK